jgi:hypothetical protein
MRNEKHGIIGAARPDPSKSKLHESAFVNVQEGELHNTPITAYGGGCAAAAAHADNWRCWLLAENDEHAE